MRDIVERLRGIFPFNGAVSAKTLCEAADEITRLRAQVQQLTVERDTYMIQSKMRPRPVDVSDLEATIQQQAEVLRVAMEALENIAELDPEDGDPQHRALLALSEIDALPTVPAQYALTEYGEQVREACAKVCEGKSRVLEARRAHADSMTLGGANHSYFTQVMTKVTECAQDIRAMTLPKLDAKGGE